MKKVVIAFDVDGTLRNNETNPYGTSDTIVANERIRSLLITLASFKNTKIVVWSGGGEWYARECVRALGLDKYVDEYGDKKLKHVQDGVIEFNPDLKPDIAIDDMHDCELGLINLIVKEK